MIGTVFDIKEMTVHDGPGSRVTVFLKGCPLRCLWCHNPEGLSAAPQLMVKENMCVQCGLCKMGCTHTECQPFGRCIHACPKGLVTVCGQQMTSDELAEKLNSYSAFLNGVGGGVTFSGGEPLMQAGFVRETADKIPNIHKALQTSGYSSAEKFKKVIEKMDYILFDLKLADEQEHIKYTGVSNKPILKNFEILKNSGNDFVVRVPLIPGITDTEKNLKGIASLVGKHRVEIMRYNSMAGAKYRSVGLEFRLPDLKSNEIDLSIFKNAVML